MTNSLEKGCFNILRQVSQERYCVATLYLSDKSITTTSCLIRAILHLGLHLHLLLVKVCVIDLAVSHLSIVHRLSTSFHRFQSEYRLCRRKQFVPSDNQGLRCIRVIHGRRSLLGGSGHAFLHGPLVRHHYSVLILLLYNYCIILSSLLSAVRTRSWSLTIWLISIQIDTERLGFL